MVQRAFVQDQSNVSLCSVRRITDGRVTLRTLGRVEFDVDVVDTAGLLAVAGEPGSTMVNGERLAMVNREVGLLGLAFGPLEAPARLVVTAVVDVRDGSSPPDDVQPGWRLFAIRRSALGEEDAPIAGGTTSPADRSIHPVEVLEADDPLATMHDWWHSNFVHYFDVDEDAPAHHADKLRSLQGTELDTALQQLDVAVAKHIAQFDDEWLPKVAAMLVDHLYRYGASLTLWDEAASLYVAHVWAPAFKRLTVSGFQMRYVVDNTWPDGIQRPLMLFPMLFQAAGLVYVCPHEAAIHLPEAVSSEHSVEGLRLLIDEGRHMANELVDWLCSEDRHFVYLEADFEEGALDHVLRLPQAPGVINVFRTEAGVPGTSYELRVVPPARPSADPA